SGLVSPKPATQPFIAFSCEEAPAPARLPVSATAASEVSVAGSVVELEPVVESVLEGDAGEAAEPHAASESARAPARIAAPAVLVRWRFTDLVSHPCGGERSGCRATLPTVGSHGDRRAESG